MYASAGNQSHLEVSSLDFPGLDHNIPLYNRSKPSDINFLVDEILVHLYIPEVIVIASYHFNLTDIITVCQLRLRFKETDSFLS